MTQISVNRGIGTSTSGNSNGGIYSSGNINRYSESGSLRSTMPWSLDTSSRRRRRKKSCRCLLTFSFSITAILLVTFPYLLSQVKPNSTSTQLKENEPKRKSDKDGKTENSNTNFYSEKEPVALIHGTVGDDQISYYHQPAISPTEENYHLVLLHGSAFSKEDWKTSGIFGLFQRNFPSISVTALDLSVRADHRKLKKLLRSMRDEDLVEQLPVSGLVTPSASGKSITTWITEEAKSGLDMENYISLWIPVASYSVASCSTSDLESLQRESSGVGVLAIYGDQDRNGKKVMQSLHDHSGAKLLELPGRHPVYLDSPDAFVKAVGEAVLMIE
eukprot:CAMPEP_0116125302 /NCGR_PEP_ID=MMETSP0329-20121206/5740_1 /TAXON_ID=697910 /ORGANISM="Pseudo-nitzschia arenysensis, Strain B593" /LENGTH=330 /DNA_ID=CAMNT_0003619337 /DNA_START=187 /DNA_END=1179 /DNA_ORIENTATION=+